MRFQKVVELTLITSKGCVASVANAPAAIAEKPCTAVEHVDEVGASRLAVSKTWFNSSVTCVVMVGLLPRTKVVLDVLIANNE